MRAGRPDLAARRRTSPVAAPPPDPEQKRKEEKMEVRVSGAGAPAGFVALDRTVDRQIRSDGDFMLPQVVTLIL